MSKLQFLSFIFLLLPTTLLAWEVEQGSINNELELTINYPDSPTNHINSAIIKITNKPNWVTFNQTSSSSNISEGENNTANFLFTISPRASVGAKGNIKIEATNGTELLGTKEIELTVIPETSLPQEFKLYQSYPNPFNIENRIKYSLPQKGRVTLNIYNSLGQLVKTLVNNEEKEPGYHESTWNGRDNRGKEVSSGIYLYAFKVENNGAIKHHSITKSILLK